MFTILPMLGLLFYLAIIVFIVWFAVTLIKSQRERNRILKEISDKLSPGDLHKE
jgi:preprotein translocase subunit YajC